jgi:DNA-binding response OmpR family regulator
LLILDDEADILDSLKTLIEKESLEVITTDSPKAALHHLEKGNIDLLIIDEVMPRHQGTEFLKKLNQSSSKIKTKPIMFTGKCRSELDDSIKGLFPHFRVFEKPHEMIALIDYCHQELYKKDRK